MSHQLPQTSSGSDIDARYAMMDEKKKKRMLSNRESARRSRLKRQKQMEDIVKEIRVLQRRILEDNQKYNLVMQTKIVIDSENNLLRAEKMRLADYLSNLESMIMNFKQSDHHCLDDQTPEISERWRRPWQVGGGPIQPIISSGMFKF